MHLLSSNPDDPRRRVLLKLLAMSGLSALPMAEALAGVLGEKPGRLPPDRSIYRLSGRVTVNGEAATIKTRINSTDTIETDKNSEIVFVNVDTAYILRASSRMNLLKESEGNLITNALRLLTGKVLAVFPPSRPQRLYSVTATIGVRGTGVYMEADPERTYFCTCYGVTDIAANNDTQSRRTVHSRHHDEPLYILAKAAEGKSIRGAPFINHTDLELMLIETLVGRQPPFVFPSEDYSGPRKDY